jgi:hypothetical protein
MAPRRPDEDTSVTSILVDQLQDLSRSQRDQGERLAALSTNLGNQNEQLRAINANIDLIRTHFTDCPARSNFESLATTVRELQAARVDTDKLLSKSGIRYNTSDSSPGTSLIPKFNSKAKMSPLMQTLIYVLIAAGSAAASWLSGLAGN